MKNWIVGTLANFAGLGKLWGYLDGMKLYLTGAMMIFGALASLLGAVIPMLSAHDFGALYAFSQGLNSNAAWHALVLGCGTIAGAHKLDKAAAPEAPNASPS